jgi:hypothetical protein
VGTIGDDAEQAMSASVPRIKKDSLTARLRLRRSVVETMRARLSTFDHAASADVPSV